MSSGQYHPISIIVTLAETNSTIPLLDLKIEDNKNMKTNTICNCPECGKNNWNISFKSDFYEYEPIFDKFDETYVDGYFIFECICGFVKEFGVGD